MKNILSNSLFLPSFFIVCLVTMCHFSYSQTVLTTGDIAIIGIKTNNDSQSGNDAIKLVTLVDLTCGTQFVVTDNNWRTGTSDWYCDDDEFALEITVTAKICAGSVIYIDVASSGGSITSSSGALTKTSLGNPWGTDYGLSSLGDNVFVLGPDNPTNSQRTSPTFIYGLKHNGVFVDKDCGTGANPKDNSGKPSTIVLGTNGVEMSSSKDQWHYNCANATSGTKATLLAAIGDKTKWRNNTTESWNNSSCSFTVTSTCTAPAHKPTSFASSSVTSTTASISWSNCTVNPGNTKVLVIARAGSAVATDPETGSTYPANPAFGSGSAIGAGFVVYDGIGTSVNLTGLVSGTAYYFSVYEYSCSGRCYNTDDLPGSITTVTVLPMELRYFQAKFDQHNNIMLEWAASATNSGRFQIEASKDGENFTIIGTIVGENTEGSHPYSFTYTNSSAMTYFRLKLLDEDGNVHYSSIKNVVSNEYREVQIFPIPASDELFVKTNGQGNVQISITDLIGKEHDAPMDINNDLYTLDVKLFPSGAYILFYKTDSESGWKRFYKR